MKIHLLAAVLVSMAAWWYELPLDEVAVLFLTIALVITTEMVNTALETIIDLVSPDYHPLAKIAKDAAAGAVLVAALAAVLVGYCLFFNRILG
jgi:diacylglycerol kinase